MQRRPTGLIPFLLFLFGGLGFGGGCVLGATNSPVYEVRRYAATGYLVPAPDRLEALLSRHTGTNLVAADIGRAADELRRDYRSRGITNISISVAPSKIVAGLATLHVFRAPSGDILISGKPFSITNLLDTRNGDPAMTGKSAPVAKTNAQPRFVVKAFDVKGDSLLPPGTIKALLDRHTGTNVMLTNIVQAASDLQKEYRSRGFPTVRVTIPQQQITNQVVKLQVFEGRLSDILVTGNRHYSSNNIMRALPSLKTNMILNSASFQAELDRANASQDRQIYPQLSPGLEENTTTLTLQTKDRFPLHGKIELNNQSSPGTPDLRINSSAAYNNLWQLEHSAGVQYSFAPEGMKEGRQWSFYDRPQVANYGAFYRMPIGAPQSIDRLMAGDPGTFGYDEASHTFKLPQPTGASELNFFASRSTIDTGTMTLFDSTLYNTNGNSLVRQDLQQDLTVNGSLGARLSLPLKSTSRFQSGISFGPDYKSYDLASMKTNVFILTSVQVDYGNDPSHPQTNVTRQVDASPVPETSRHLDYLPLGFRYNASLNDSRGVTTFGLGVSGNAWHSGTSRDLQNIAGSEQAGGHWIVLTPSLGRDFILHSNWVFSVRADGQWANEPLISNEQFGLGGLAGVRGYHEGQVFGDTGWRITAEQKTPYYGVGMAYRDHPLMVRGSFFFDYGEAYLIDPLGRNDRMRLGGIGFGGVASIGANWDARLLFSWPLLNVGPIQAGQPRFDFVVTAQF